MVTVAEAAATAKTELAAGLALGVNTLSGNQTITFTKYIRTVLPADGFVFWVRADLLSPSALYNAAAYNTAMYGQPADVIMEAPTIQVQGSLHYATANSQDEDAAYSENTVIFTAEEEVENLNEVSPMVKYIGEFDGLRFAFADRGRYYQQAGLHHYVGAAVYSTMDTQIIDNIDDLNLADQIVSNSLPIWLTFNQAFPVFPSYLVPDNLPPPYCSVHVVPAETSGIGQFPILDAMSNQQQLCHDKIRLVTFGVRNDGAQDFLQTIFNASLMTEAFGIQNIPVIKDDKATQRELSILGQKKVIDVEISYYQSRVRDIARQFITSATCAFTPGD